MKTFFSFILALIASFTLIAQSADSLCIDTSTHTTFKRGLLKVPTFGRPFWADMHSTITKAEFAVATNSREYDYDQTGKPYRTFLFTTLGIDFPLWTGSFKNHKYGLSFTVPFSVDIWMDLFENITQPVINTSYRISTPEISFIHRFDKPFWIIRNYSFRVSLWKHESTHLGDELTIKRKSLGFPITRINVNYNFSELSFMLNDPDGALKQNHSLKLGLLFLSSDYNSGWYNAISEEANKKLVKSNKYKFEWYAQYQYQTNTHKRTGLQGIASIELRNRPVYQYPFFTQKDGNGLWIGQISENQMSWNVNVFLGVRYNNPMIMKYYRIGLGLRGYTGINPYGQFRNMPNYSQFGLALILE